MSATQVQSSHFSSAHATAEQQLFQEKQASVQARNAIRGSLWFNGLSLLAWPMLAFLCVFAFDKPGSETSPVIWGFVIPILAYPAYNAVFTIIGLIFKYRCQLQRAQIFMSLPRRIVNVYLLVFLVTAILIELKNS